jgi:D-3-phosphoglycerate dehydrogenase
MPQVVLTSHIDGLTQEAQYNIGQEVARKLLHDIDDGSTKGLINFPLVSLIPHEGAYRLMPIHRNISGVLAQINRLFEEKKINILSQFVMTNSEIGYVILDVGKEMTERGLLTDLKNIKETIGVRLIQSIG